MVPLAALLVVSALLLSASTASAAPGDATADRVFGQGGSFTSGTCNLPASPDTTLCAPWGVALDSGGRLYVADTNNNRVLIYNNPLGSSVANQIINIGPGGLPQGLTLDSAGRLYVAVSSSRVFEYDTPLTSTALSRNITLPPGTYGLGVAVDSGGRLYVADGYLSRVLILDTPLTSDTVHHTIGTGGGSFPTGVALDSAGRLYMADAGNHRVVRYDSPLTSSIPTGVIGQPGYGLGTCNNGGLDSGSLCGPLGLAMGPGGSLYASDANNNRVLQFNDPLGSCGTCDTTADTVFGQAGSFVSPNCNLGGINAGSLCHPQGVAVGPNGDVWVADSFNNRVLEYDGQGCSASPSASGSVGPGGTVTTDPTGAGATSCQTIQASVTTPTGGSISINVQPSAGPQYISQQVQISAPAATPASPLTLTFNIDASLLGPGQDLNSIQVFRNGTHVFDCGAGPGVAGPDPCVSSKATVGGSDLRFTVLSSSGSVWNFGPYTPVGGNILLPVGHSGDGNWLWLAVAPAFAALFAAAYVARQRRRTA